jgi:hypothetical protein
MHVHVFDKSHITPLSDRFQHLGRYYTTLVYGMLESQTLAQIFLRVLKKSTSSFEEVPFPSCTNIHFARFPTM